MDQLLELAETSHDGKDSDEILKFSSELMAMASRLSELTREKLQVEFENRELKARTVPVQIELDAAREEIKFSKNQVKEFWTEIESLSKQKAELYRERCETVRRLTDEVALLTVERAADGNRFEIAEAEKERFRQQLVAERSEWKAKLEDVHVETCALRERAEKQESLIGVLEKQGEVCEKQQERIRELQREMGLKNLELVDSKNMLEMHKEAECSLKAEKEQLLEQLVRNRDNKKAVSSADLLLGKGWNLSDLVDSLSQAKHQLGEKRTEIDSLHSAIGEMREKLPSVEASYVNLERCEAELEDVKLYNEKIKTQFEQREDEIDRLRFEKLKIETDFQSMQLRCGELGKQLAVMIHESESLRGRAGIHAGPGRSHPMLTMAATPSPSSGPKIIAEVVPHFRTVHDLVEQNLELKEKLDNLLSKTETESQMELQKLRVKLEKLELRNSDILLSREEEKNNFERSVARLESELKRCQSESDRLRKFLLVSNEEDVEMDHSEETNDVVRNEFKKRLASVNGELETARQMCARTVAELDRIREDLKREIDEKNQYIRSFEKTKSESLSAQERERTLRSRLNNTELEKDALTARFEEAKTREILSDKLRRDLEHQISALQAVVNANEKAYSALASEKETQSAVLVESHTRLDQEARMYQLNSESLRKLYEQEFEKSKSTLNFYQTAYEEQVKRANELSAQVARLTADLDEIKSIEKRVALPETTTHSSVEVTRLESELKSTTVEVEKWREMATVNEGLVQQLRVELEQLVSEQAEKNNEAADIVMVSASQEELSVREDELRVSREEIERKNVELSRITLELENLRPVAAKVAELEETLHRERLLLSVREVGFSEQLYELRIKSELAEEERNNSEKRITSLLSENEQYLRRFANEMSGPEKEEQGKLILEQLQSSISAHSVRESQLLSDLQRCRSTLDMLLRENQNLKSVVDKLESTVAEFERFKLAQETRCDSQTIENEKKLLEEQLEQALSQAAEYRQLHSELALKLSSSAGVDQIAEAKVVQLEKAKSQLTQTVSKLRESAEKKTAEIHSLSEKLGKLETNLFEKVGEIARQEGLVKLKEKRIADLETLSEPSAQVKQLMDLVNNYQAALTSLQAKLSRTGGDQPVSPTVKKPRKEPSNLSLQDDQDMMSNQD